MTRTDLSISEYQVTGVSNQSLQVKSTRSGIFREDEVGWNELTGLPIGPAVHFEVEEYDFQRLVNELVELEREHGISSVQMFCRYIQGQLDLDEMEDWLDLFLLWLGTDEIRRFSCP